MYNMNRAGMTKEELDNIEVKLPKVLEKEYILLCYRFPICPYDFMRLKTEEGGESYYYSCIKVAEKLERHHEKILKFHKPVRRYENPEVTLKEYCSKNTIDISPIECV